MSGRGRPVLSYVDRALTRLRASRQDAEDDLAVNSLPTRRPLVIQSATSPIRCADRFRGIMRGRAGPGVRMAACVWGDLRLGLYLPKDAGGHSRQASWPLKRCRVASATVMGAMTSRSAEGTYEERAVPRKLHSGPDAIRMSQSNGRAWIQQPCGLIVPPGLHASAAARCRRAGRPGPARPGRKSAGFTRTDCDAQHALIAARRRG